MNNSEFGGPRTSWIDEILLLHLCIVCFITFLAIYQGKFGFGKFQQKLGLRTDPPPPLLGQKQKFFREKKLMAPLSCMCWKKLEFCASSLPRIKLYLQSKKLSRRQVNVETLKSWMKGLINLGLSLRNMKCETWLQGVEGEKTGYFVPNQPCSPPLPPSPPNPHMSTHASLPQTRYYCHPQIWPSDYIFNPFAFFNSTAETFSIDIDI